MPDAVAEKRADSDVATAAADRPGLVRRIISALSPRRPSGEMPRARRLVIGLGNPGADYAETRHNAGFMVADALSERIRAAFEPARGPYVVASASWRGTPVAVAKPAGLYMNQSGTAVRKLMGHFGITEQDLLLVYDDISLEPGQIRLRAGGGAGGHNGVQDVIDQLGSDTFPRLRIGIGSSFPRGGQVDYVLGRFTPEQEPLIEEAIVRAVDAALAFAREGLNVAMNRFNRRQPAGD